MTGRTRTALIALSIVAAVLAMGLWLRSFGVSSQDMDRLATRLTWWPAPLLFALLAGHVALASWRWSLIEVGLGGVRPRFRDAYAAGAFALGLGTFLPAPIVNVACRGIGNRMSGASGLRGALSGGIDQAADLAVIILLAVPAAIAFVHRDVRIYLLGIAVMGLLGLALTMALPTLARAAARLWPSAGAGPLSARLNRRLLVQIYALSLLRTANLTAMTLAIHTMTGAAMVSAIMVGIPLITLAISAAMLPGAFGVSEWSFSVVLARFGVPSDEIVLFVLGNRIVLTILSLALALAVLLSLLPALVRRGRASPSL